MNKSIVLNELWLLEIMKFYGQESKIWTQEIIEVISNIQSIE